MEFIGQIFSILVYVVVLFVIFIVTRGLVLWYWKVNEMVDLLKSIDYKLGRIGQSDSRGQVPTTPPNNKAKVNPKTALKNFEPLKDE